MKKLFITKVLCLLLLNLSAQESEIIRHEEEGLVFTIVPAARVEDVTSSAGFRYPVVSTPIIIMKANPQDGFRYRGKFYDRNAFGGEVWKAIEAIRVTAVKMDVIVEYSSGKTTTIYGSWALGTQKGNSIVTTPKGFNSRIVGYKVVGIVGTGLSDLKAKIDALERAAAQNSTIPNTGNTNTTSTASTEKSNNTGKTTTTGTSGITDKTSASKTSTGNRTTTGGINPSGVSSTNTGTTTNSISEKQQAANLTNDANTLYNQGKYSEAISKYNEALKLDPGNAAINQNLSNAREAYNQVLQRQQSQQKAQISQNAIQSFANTGSTIASSVLSEKHGRFGVFYAENDNGVPAYGITFGNADIMQINLGADFQDFSHFLISMDLMGVRLFASKEKRQKTSVVSEPFRIVPAVGFSMISGKTNSSGDLLPGQVDYSSGQLGLTLLMQPKGVTIKISCLYDVIYMDKESKPANRAATLVLGFSFGK